MAKNQAPEQVREQVRQAASAHWGQQAAVLHVRKRAITYQVPGRARDGRPATRTWYGALLRGIVVVAYTLVAVPFLLLFAFLDDLGIDPFGSGGTAGRCTVTGAADGAALPAADAVRDCPAGTDLWLVWSHDHLALFVAAPQPRPVWQALAHQRPRLQPKEAALRWADGSALTLPVRTAESKRVTRSNGRP